MSSKKEFADLVDFFSRWPDERNKAEQIREIAGLSKEQRDILGAMIFIIDRVGPDDLAP